MNMMNFVAIISFWMLYPQARTNVPVRGEDVKMRGKNSFIFKGRSSNPSGDQIFERCLYIVVVSVSKPTDRLLAFILEENFMINNLNCLFATFASLIVRIFLYKFSASNKYKAGWFGGKFLM